MKILPNKKKFLQKIHSLIFPDYCINCDRLIKSPYLCQDCKLLIKPIDVKLCIKCGLPVKECLCNYYFYYFNKITAPFYNEKSARKSFYGFKFHSNYRAAGFFADAMSEKIKKDFKNEKIDVITFVPMYKKDKSKRGYNQAKVLAKKISKNLKIPLKTLLWQPKPTQKQHFLVGIHNRFDGVRNRFDFVKSGNVSGKTVLIIDDIKTTGATLSECARIIKLKGAEKVLCATALVTLKNKNDL